jgi:predicted Zn-dependent peptidase
MISRNLGLNFLIKSQDSGIRSRFKNTKVIDEKPRREETIKDLEEEIWKHLEKTNVEIVEDASLQAEQKRKLALDFLESDDDDDESSPDAVKKEVEKYRNEPMQEKDGDPLAWWRKRKEIYPNLVRLVRYV